MHWKLVVGAVLAALVVAGGMALLSSYREHAALLEFKHGLQELQQKINGFAIAEPGGREIVELNIPKQVKELIFEQRAIRVAYENGSVESYGVELDLSGPKLTPDKYVLHLTKTDPNVVTIEISE